MAENGLKSEKYKPCFSGHETFPLRYGWLQKAYKAVVESDSAKDAARIFRNPESIARFGVGRNMVSSIRYWAIAVGILADNRDEIKVSWLGDLLFGTHGVDPYLEQDSSLWLLHWHLASRTRITAAYWLFSEFRGGAVL